MSKARAVVAGHAEFASGVVSAVVQITGRDDVFLSLSNRGMSTQDVERALRDLVTPDGIDVVFTDLPAGSCTMAARRLQRERPALIVVTGTNLAILLDFVFSAEHEPAEALRAAIEKGRAALMVTGSGPVGGSRAD